MEQCNYRDTLNRIQNEEEDLRLNADNVTVCK